MISEHFKSGESHIEVSVELCVRGDFDPNEITEKTGITPSKTAIKGSRNHSLKLPLYSGWTIASRLVPLNLENMNKIISEVILNVFNDKDNFKRTLKELDAEVGLVILIKNYAPSEPLSYGYEIHENVIKLLADINASIEISVCAVVS